MVKPVKYKEVERVLLKAGWRVSRTNGSHEIWKGPEGKGRLIIPRHNDVTPGVIRDVRKAIPDIPNNWR